MFDFMSWMLLSGSLCSSNFKIYLLDSFYTFDGLCLIGCCIYSDLAIWAVNWRRCWRITHFRVNYVGLGCRTVVMKGDTANSSMDVKQSLNIGGQTHCFKAGVHRQSTRTTKLMMTGESHFGWWRDSRVAIPEGPQVANQGETSIKH